MLDLLIAILSNLIYNLIFGSRKVRKATAKRIRGITHYLSTTTGKALTGMGQGFKRTIIYLDMFFSSQAGRFFINSTILLLLLLCPLLGGLNFAVLFQENRPLWMCMTASILPTVAVLPLISTVYRQKSGAGYPNRI